MFVKIPAKSSYLGAEYHIVNTDTITCISVRERDASVCWDYQRPVNISLEALDILLKAINNNNKLQDL